jgi:quinol monooxygenase YgiN
MPISTVVSISTNADQSDAFADILARAGKLVEKEPGTLSWLAARGQEDRNAFFIVELFTAQADADAHLAGEAAALLLGEGGPMFAAAPVITVAEVIATKPAS